jgi:hypothetical protein
MLLVGSRVLPLRGCFSRRTRAIDASPSVRSPHPGARHDDLGDGTKKELGHERVAQSLDGLLLFGRELHLLEGARDLAAPDLLGGALAGSLEVCSW